MKTETTFSRLLGTWGVKKNEEVEAVANEALATLQAEFDTFRLASDEQITELSEKLSSAVEAVQAADTQIASLQTELASWEAAAKAAATTARKEKIVAAVGDARADALMTATEGLEDAAFNAVLSAMTLTADAENKSAMFTEVGIAAEVDPANVANPESEEMKILKATYKQAAKA